MIRGTTPTPTMIVVDEWPLVSSCLFIDTGTEGTAAVSVARHAEMYVVQDAPPVPSRFLAHMPAPPKSTHNNRAARRKAKSEARRK